MAKKILVPVHNSEASLNALKIAIHITAVAGAQLHILFINDITGEKETSHADDDPKRFYDAVVEKMLAELNIKASISFLEGIVGHAIVKYAFEQKIGAVIMGVHGESQSRDFSIGPNSYYVIKRVTCPVLLIPANYKRLEFKKILFPVRPKIFTEELCTTIYDTIGNDSILSEMTVLGIFTDKYDYDILQLSTKVFEVRNKNINGKSHLSLAFCKNPDVAEEVLNILDQIKADLVVISPGIDTVSRPSFIGPFSQKIINNAIIPVLSIVGCIR